jgi:hypothetical protein
MEAANATKSPSDPFAAVQDLFSQSQQFWHERAAQTAEDVVELYKAGLEYSHQLTTVTLDAARRSFALLTPKT